MDGRWETWEALASWCRLVVSCLLALASAHHNFTTDPDKMKLFRFAAELTRRQTCVRLVNRYAGARLSSVASVQPTVALPRLTASQRALFPPVCSRSIFTAIGSMHGSPAPFQGVLRRSALSLAHEEKSAFTRAKPCAPASVTSGAAIARLFARGLAKQVPSRGRRNMLKAKKKTKLRTHAGSKKRFKWIRGGKGKIKRFKVTSTGHKRVSKSPGRKLRLKKAEYFKGGHLKKMKRLLRAYTWTKL